MLNKKNSKILLIIFLVLIGLFFVLRYTDHSNSTIVEELVKADTAKVDQIVIHPPKGAPVITLLKKTGKWWVKSSNEQHQADRRKMKGILFDLTSLKPESVVATSKKQWKKYQLTDSLATRIQVIEGGKVKSDILLGKFSYLPAKNQKPNPYQRRPQGEMISYVRTYGNANVYSVDGMIKMNFGANPDNYRDKTFVKMDKNTITKVDFTYPGAKPFSLQKDKQYWKIDHEPADSMTVVRYLRYLSRTTASKIVHRFDKTKNPQIGKISIERENNKPVELMAYAIDSAQYVIHSSLNDDTYFDGNSGKLYSRFFVDKNYFLKKNKVTKKEK